MFFLEYFLRIVGGVVVIPAACVVFCLELLVEFIDVVFIRPATRLSEHGAYFHVLRKAQRLGKIWDAKNHGARLRLNRLKKDFQNQLAAEQEQRTPKA
jgi:hypothetical protein